jgi:signal transduction histidine kinase
VWALVALSVVLTLVFAGLVARHLTADARRSSEFYARVFAGLADPSEDGATSALLDIAAQIRSEGIPLVVTDAAGTPTDTANLPRALAFDSPAMRAFIAELDRRNAPVARAGVGTIHFGSPPVRYQLRLMFALELTSLVAVLAAGWLAWRATLRAARGRVFVAMARESAHQLGTPLTSLAGWIEQLRTGATPPHEIAEHLADDYARLDRVSRRFERIGQPARREAVDVAALAEKVAGYFRPRLPRLANPIAVTVSVDSRAPMVQGDPLLLEWALEVLVKNGVDALKGRAGSIALSVRDEPDSLVLRVEDDGPGVPAEVRSQMFEAGLTTKTGGWGLGLALARRIVEESHEGRLVLEPSPVGARFAIRLPRGEARS